MNNYKYYKSFLKKITNKILGSKSEIENFLSNGKYFAFILKRHPCLPHGSPSYLIFDVEVLKF